MKIKIALGGILIAGFIVAALGLQGVGSAQTNSILLRGAGHAGIFTENPFRFETLKKIALRRKFSTIKTDRNLIVVPSFYGEPFTVTTVGEKSIIWYRASDSTVRNVIVRQGDSLIRTSVQEGKERTL
jgi:hypothetical protein